MDQSPITQPPITPASTPVSAPPPKKRVRTLALVVIILAALGAIAVSVYVMMNPRGPETSAIESFSVATITERGIAPSTVTVKRGDSIIWKNQDAVAHTLVITSPNPPEELQGFGGGEAIAQGESYSFTFDTSGTFTYNDPAYPEQIQGTIIVE